MNIVKSKKHQIKVFKDRCLLCGVCEAVCSKNAITVFSTEIEISQDNCNGCGKCIEACPVEALL